MAPGSGPERRVPRRGDALVGFASIYLPQMRTLSAVILETFDGPESSFVTGDRDETNVPSQALLMLNSDWVTRQADEMASMLSLDVDDRRRQEIAFLRTLGRPPTSLERSAIRRFFADFGALLDNGEAIDDQRGQQARDRVRRRNQRRRGLAEAPRPPRTTWRNCSRPGPPDRVERALPVHLRQRRIQVPRLMEAVHDAI